MTHKTTIKRLVFFGILLSLLMGITLSLKAQKVSFKASAPQVVQQGEQFELRYTVNQSCKNFRYPQYNGFTLLGGPMTSNSSSVQIINGKVSRKETHSYVLYLQANNPGKYTLPAAVVTVKGKTYKSNTVSIEVVKGNGTSSSQRSQTAGTQSETVKNAPNKDLFVRVLTNKKTVFQGEQLIATIKIYTRIGISGFDDMKFPDFKGFWQDEIKTPDQIQLHRENVNGKIYNVGILKKLILTPQHSGKLTIEPIDLVCVVQQRTRQRDFFGFPVYRKGKMEIKSPRVTIRVKSLPPLSQNNDSNFTGAVGDFKLKSTISQTDIKENNPITLKVTIQGAGNLSLIDNPAVNMPPDFESYDPKESDHITKTERGTSGRKTWEYLVIPRHAGSFTIPPVTFTYFDLKTKRYKTLSSKSFDITVKKGDGNNNQIVTSAFSKENVKYIGKDIHYLKPRIAHLIKKNEHFFGSWAFYLTYPIGLLVFIVIVLWRKKQIKEMANKAKMRNRKALMAAKKRLKKASVFMKENNKSAFFEEISRALWLLLADKLNIDLADLTKDIAIERLSQKNIDQELIDSYFTFLESIDFLRFANQTNTENILTDNYEKAKSLIVELSNKF
jgi:hypothetical protein